MLLNKSGFEGGLAGGAGQMVIDMFKVTQRFVASARASLRSPVPPSSLHWLWGNPLLLEGRAASYPSCLPTALSARF